MRQAELEIQGGDGLVELLGLGQGLERVGRVAGAQPGATDDVVRSRGISIEPQGFVGRADGFGGLIGQEMGVGQVEMGLNGRGLVPQRLLEELDRPGAIALFELAFAEAGVLHQGEYLSDSDPTLKAFAAFLLNRGVARLAFRRGLDAASLTQFLRLLGSDPRSLTTQGGLARQLQEMHVSTIVLGEIDLEKILASEAESVPGENASTQEEKGAWKRLVTNYLREPAGTSPAGIRTLLKGLATEPSRLAEWLEDAGSGAGVRTLRRYNKISKTQTRMYAMPPLAECRASVAAAMRISPKPRRA